MPQAVMLFAYSFGSKIQTIFLCSGVINFDRPKRGFLFGNLHSSAANGNITDSVKMK